MTQPPLTIRTSGKNTQFSLLKHSISKKYINWYVLRTKQYIAAFPEILIRQHPHQQVEGYINTKAQDIQLKSWQFAQVIDALRILFSLELKANWASLKPMTQRRKNAVDR